MKKNSFLILLLVIFISCEESFIPKPYGHYRLDIPKNEYEKYNGKFFSYEKSIYSKIIHKKVNNYFIDINYPKLNATFHCTYKKVNKKNLNIIMEDIEKFTYKHTIKAESIKDKLFENKDKNTIGMIHTLEGNTATNLQFYITDKNKNLLSGSLYFFIQPNYDSLLPVIKYLEKDVKVLMETLEWKK